MVGERKKKYASGEGTQYMSRKHALQYLQLSLKYFRKLCILKGIYPREPLNRKKAQKGKTNVATLYSKKDIKFLSHEPLIEKIRDIKIFSKKMGKAYAFKDLENMKRLVDNHPTLRLDHIIKERYPTFIDALRDLDDCLPLCFLFSTFPSLKHVPRDQSALSRRLTVEFMHACIAARALRKVFVSIKGFYYQVELMGQTITWIAPHNFSFRPLSIEEVDFRIMATFSELYTVLLGFINYQLFQSLGLVYPPRLQGRSLSQSTSKEAVVDEGQFVSERIAALNQPIIVSGTAPEDAHIDQFPVGAEDDAEFERQREEIAASQRQKTLFNGLKVFLSRETPREPLTFVLRCLGGQVSWDPLLFAGATFIESDETITHQIIDRPTVPRQYLSRYYVQPQWVFDCVNARQLLPVDKYLIGAVLPPHLSPFVAADRSRVYQPPEETPDTTRYQPETTEPGENEEPEEEMESQYGDKEDDSKTAGMAVTRGSAQEADGRAAGRAIRQERELRERMVGRQHRRLYKSMVETRKKNAKEIWLLRKKRRLIDQEQKDAAAKSD